MYTGDLRFGIILPYFKGKTVTTKKDGNVIKLPDVILATDSYFLPVKMENEAPSEDEIINAINAKLSIKIRWNMPFVQGMEHKYIYGSISKLEKALSYVNKYISFINNESSEIKDETYNFYEEGLNVKTNIGVGTKGWYYADNKGREYVPRHIFIKKMSKEYWKNFRTFEAFLFYRGFLYPDQYEIISNKCGYIRAIRRTEDIDDLIDQASRLEEDYKLREKTNRRKKCS